MKNLDQQFQRLLKSAARANAQEAPVAEPSAALENRIIGNWRAGLSVENPFDWSLLVFRRALACSFLLMMLAFAWSYGQSGDLPADEVFLAEVETELTLLP